MSKNQKDQSKIQNTYKTLGLGIGLVVGGLIGILVDNMIIFAGGGMVLGFAIGTYLDNQKMRGDQL